jgi:hypothetical protein
MGHVSLTELSVCIGVSLLILVAGAQATVSPDENATVMSFSEDPATQNQVSNTATEIQNATSDKKEEGMTLRRLFQIKKASTIPTEYLAVINGTMVGTPSGNKTQSVVSEKPCPGLTCGR